MMGSFALQSLTISLNRASSLNVRALTSVLRLVVMRILRGLGSRILDCGCLVGFYETYRGRTIAILDARDTTCSNMTHRVGVPLDLDSSEVPDSGTPRNPPLPNLS
jgi:hypothetical protein